MQKNAGTLTIRREIAVPMQSDARTTKYRLATLAVYQGITQAECPEMIDRFCDANNVSRSHLFCEWKFVTHF